MVCVALLARACGARLLSWNALALAALVVAALWPVAVGSVSFALSFSCVGGDRPVRSAAVARARARHVAGQVGWDAPGRLGTMLRGRLGAMRLGGMLPKRVRESAAERVREALALTAATQLGVWPLSAATSASSRRTRSSRTPWSCRRRALAMLAGTAALALAGVPVLGSAAATVTAWDVDAILRVVGAVAALPGARVWVAPPPALAIVAYDLAALLAAWLLSRRPRIAVALLLAASAGVLARRCGCPTGG